MIEAQQSSTLCRYQLLSGDIHEIVLSESSRQSVDEWFAMMEHLEKNSPAEAPLRLLLDVTAGMQPLGYVMSRSRQFLANHPERHLYRAVILYRERDFLLRMMQVSLSALPLKRQDQIKLYPSAQRSQALAWLQAQV